MRQEKVAYDGIETDIGRLWIAVSSRGLRRVALNETEEEFRAELRRDTNAELVRDPNAVAPVRAQLLEYFAGRRRDFDVALDLEDLTPFQREVLLACAKIPYGQTVSYAELARRVGRPKAARAVGGVMAHNPVSLVIPCHRVVRSDGNLGGYGGGLELKQRLLAMESAAR